MIPYVDVGAQYRELKAEIDGAFTAVAAGGRYTLGPFVEAFEAAFAAHLGVPHVVAVSSGTTALTLSLLALGIGPGDEVVTSPFTFVATAAAIHGTGARPIFADIDPATLTLDPNRVAEVITPRTKAILPVHVYGHPAKMDDLLALARPRNIAVVEDAAQAHGARQHDVPVGTSGDAGCFSFHPTKNLGGMGEGGAVATTRADLAEKVRLLRDWGAPSRHQHVLRGTNGRMGALEAAVLAVKLPHLGRWNETRRRHAEAYDDALAGLPLALPQRAPGAAHAFHIYAVRVPLRDGVHEAMARHGVETAIHYPRCVHEQPAYADPRQPPGSFPAAESLARECLCLPISPALTDEQRQGVVTALRDAVTS